MRAGLLRICLISVVSIITAFPVTPQTRGQRKRAPAKTNAPINAPTPQPTPEVVAEPTPEPTPPDEDQQEVLKITTDLVTVPVIATTTNGNYVPDLRQDEFNISEDGVQQEVAFFATVSAPFHVVLLLDTSASTKDKLGTIRRSAIAFVEQLQLGDRVKVISFDDKVRDLSEFTNDRSILRGAINRTEPGQGTKLYDAMDLALSSVRIIQGRKAIVLFSDGVDWRSDQATFDGTLHWLDEEGAIVYAIRYDTRDETERIARQQAGEPQLPTIDVIRKPPPGTTAPTFPSEDPDAVPTAGKSDPTGPFGLPSAREILRRRGEQRDRDRERNDPNYPRPDRIPDPQDPTGRRSDGSYPPAGRDGTGYPGSSRRGTRPDDSISAMLDHLYVTADSYLGALTEKSGGRIVRADTVASLPDAFAQIAAELRTQYAIGYYPTNKARDGKYRKIKVGSARKSVILRARPGYRAPSGG
ncbi:MAG: VWA domain-containing protein [Acidobacteriota bacterium]|nr:VWA domain-containing protein [Acidobacteriota bacterium]